MTKKIPDSVMYRGATYRRVGAFDPSEILLYDYLRKRGGVEAGIAYCPEGKQHPGWVDKGGWKYAEITPPEGSTQQAFVRIDNRPGWRWEWDEGTSQEDVATYLGNEGIVV